MKKLIAIMLSAVMLLSFASCAKDNPATPDTSVPSQSEETDATQKQNVDDSDTIESVWKTKDIDYENEASALKTTVYEHVVDGVNVKTKLLVSPIEIENDIIDIVHAIPDFKGSTVSLKKIHERGSDYSSYSDLPGIYHQVEKDIDYVFTTLGKTLSIGVEYDAAHYNGCKKLTVTYLDYETGLEDIQENAFNILSYFVGNKYANVLVYASSDGSKNFNEEIMYEEPGMNFLYQDLKREMGGELDSRQVKFEISCFAQTDSWGGFQHRHTTPEVDNAKYTLDDLFGGRLGTKLDFETPNNSFDTFMNSCSEPYLHTAIEDYEYTFTEKNGEKEYNLRCDVIRAEENTSSLVSPRLELNLTVFEDADEKIKSVSFVVDSTTPYNKTSDTVNASYIKEALAEAIAQMKVAFGDAFDLSVNDITVPENGQVNYKTEIPFNAFGLKKTITAEIIAGQNFSGEIHSGWKCVGAISAN